MSGSFPRLLGISGSLRRDSFNTAVLRGIAEALRGKVALTIHPLNDIPPYDGDRDGEEPPTPVRALKAAIAECDGVVLCSPEYNWGMSGVLKNAIDWASRPSFASPLKGKPALLMSASPGSAGGARAHVQMRDAMASALARVVARPPVTISLAHQKAADGRLFDKASLDFAVAAVDDLLDEIELVSGHRSKRV